MTTEQHTSPATPKSTKTRAKKQPRVARKDVIVEVARTLFNERGVSAVTTNHIAAEMGISPGNLYYHYRNKEDIILTAFQRLVDEVDPILNIGEDEVIDAARLTGDIEAVLRVMMRYRFLFPEVMSLTLSDKRFAQAFHQLQDRTVNRIVGSLLTSYAAGPLVKKMPEAYTHALARNMWLLIINWVNYVRVSQDGTISPMQEGDLMKGVFHIFVMLRPYMSHAAINDIEKLFPDMPTFAPDESTDEAGAENGNEKSIPRS
ncbi:MAG: TetR/AcrR family transcriptional regulator [Alphaproteobacteria bacterium]